MYGTLGAGTPPYQELLFVILTTLARVGLSPPIVGAEIADVDEALDDFVLQRVGTRSNQLGIRVRCPDDRGWARGSSAIPARSRFWGAILYETPGV